ncbi:tectonic, partial [Culicoides brevitarsis]|uniref:tectonic n=1 Tax=Culicoides brevitarsis TaxID=469753 RepID=UPI00307C7251
LTTSAVPNSTKIENLSTTTPIPSTSTTQTTPTSTISIETTTEKPQIWKPFSGFINRRAENKISDYFCNCDTQINVCEVNCCCDLDCSKGAIQLFDCSKERFDVQEYDYYGKLEDCSISGGLLCVAGSNLKKIDFSFYDVGRKNEISSKKWPEIFGNIENSPKNEKIERYDMNDVVLVFNETTEMIQKMIISQNLGVTSNKCFVQEPILWLRDAKSECPYTKIHENWLDSWKNMKFLRYPVVSSMEYHCTNESCSNVTISRAFRNHSVAGIDRISVEFIIWHNFTNILGEVQLNVTHDDYENAENEEKFIEFRVIFKSFEEKYLEKFPPMSGMPGYAKEMPLLTSKKVTFSNYTQENKEFVLDFFVFNNRSAPYHANRTLKLPQTRRGRCLLDSAHQDFINFGENRFIKCNFPLKLDPKSINSEANFTEICQNYQFQIFSMLLNSHDFEKDNFTSNIFVSQLGHPKNSTDDWILLKFLNAPNGEQESVTGNWRQDTKNSFTCTNMVINVKYEFFYAQLRIAGVDFQNVVKEATLNFGPRLDLHFRVNDVSVPVFVQTQFYDLTRMSNSGGRSFIEVLVIFSCLSVSLSWK